MPDDVIPFEYKGFEARAEYVGEDEGHPHYSVYLCVYERWWACGTVSDSSFSNNDDVIHNAESACDKLLENLRAVVKSPPPSEEE